MNFVAVPPMWHWSLALCFICESEYPWILVISLEMVEYFGFGFKTSFGLRFLAESKAGFGFGFYPKPS